MKIENIKNEKGIPVKNQFVISNEDTIIFQSYESKIAKYNKNYKTLKLYGDLWRFSKTTQKHFKSFVNGYTCFGYDNQNDFKKLVEVEMKDRIKIIN